jgi:hypothetical protein
MQGSPTVRTTLVGLPRATKATKYLDGELRRHPDAVVDNPHLADSAETTFNQRDPHIVGVCIESVPDQLSNSGKGLPNQSLKVVGLYVYVMPGQGAPPLGTRSPCRKDTHQDVTAARS